MNPNIIPNIKFYNNENVMSYAQFKSVPIIGTYEDDLSMYGSYKIYKSHWNDMFPGALSDINENYLVIQNNELTDHNISKIDTNTIIKIKLHTWLFNKVTKQEEYKSDTIFKENANVTSYFLTNTKYIYI